MTISNPFQQIKQTSYCMHGNRDKHKHEQYQHQPIEVQYQQHEQLSVQVQVQDRQEYVDGSRYAWKEHGSCRWVMGSVMGLLLVVGVVVVIGYPGVPIRAGQTRKDINNDADIKTTTQPQALTSPTTDPQKTTPIIPSEQAPTSSLPNLFTNLTHNTDYFPTLYSYLVHNQVKFILIIGRQDHGQREGMQGLEVGYHDGGVIGVVYDWIHVCGGVEDVRAISQKSKLGVSVQINTTEQYEETLTKLKQDLGNQFYYQQPKSLQLFQTQLQPILIFIKSPSPCPSPSPQSLVSIHTVLRLPENIPYLREWLGYHWHLGVTKFYIYDNSRSERSELVGFDDQVTGDRNKLGMSLGCMGNSGEQAWDKWRQLWQDYYWNIIYIRWQPKDDNGTITYGQLQAQHNYIHYFANISLYTAFIDPDEYIFSPSNTNLVQFLTLKLNNNITAIKLRSTHFVNRICVPYSRVTDIGWYFPEYQRTGGRIWSPKLIAVTKYFVPWGSIHDGKIRQGSMEVVASSELRINHYNFEFHGLEEARREGFSGATNFWSDFSLTIRYKNVIDEVCKNLACSQQFSLKCPQKQSFKYCLNTSDRFEKNLDLKLLKIKLQQGK